MSSLSTTPPAAAAELPMPNLGVPEAVFMKGEMKLVDGHAQVNGQWALKQRLFSGDKNSFTFRSVDPATQKTHSGRYGGHFFIRPKNGGLRQVADSSELKFEPHRGGGYNVSGSAMNEFGPSRIIGTMTPGGTFVIFRISPDQEAAAVKAGGVGTTAAAAASAGPKAAVKGSGGVRRTGSAAGTKNSKVLSAAEKELKEKCLQLWTYVVKRDESKWFKDPVNPKRLNIPTYFNIIKEPMDHGTIKKKIEGRKYASWEDFVKDMRLVLSNAITFNPPTHIAHVDSVKLQKIQEDEIAKLEKLPSPKAEVLPLMIPEEPVKAIVNTAAPSSISSVSSATPAVATAAAHMPVAVKAAPSSAAPTVPREAMKQDDQMQLSKDMLKFFQSQTTDDDKAFAYVIWKHIMALVPPEMLQQVGDNFEIEVSVIPAKGQWQLRDLLDRHRRLEQQLQEQQIHSVKELTKEGSSNGKTVSSSAEVGVGGSPEKKKRPRPVESDLMSDGSNGIIGGSNKHAKEEERDSSDDGDADEVAVRMRTKRPKLTSSPHRLLVPGFSGDGGGAQKETSGSKAVTEGKQSQSGQEQEAISKDSATSAGSILVVPAAQGQEQGLGGGTESAAIPSTSSMLSVLDTTPQVTVQVKVSNTAAWNFDETDSSSEQKKKEKAAADASIWALARMEKGDRERREIERRGQEQLELKRKMELEALRAEQLTKDAERMKRERELEQQRAKEEEARRVKQAEEKLKREREAARLKREQTGQNVNLDQVRADQELMDMMSVDRVNI